MNVKDLGLLNIGDILIRNAPIGCKCILFKVRSIRKHEDYKHNSVTVIHCNGLKSTEYTISSLNCHLYEICDKSKYLTLFI